MMAWHECCEREWNGKREKEKRSGGWCVEWWKGMAKQECGGNGLCVNNGHSTIDVWNVFWCITNQSTMCSLKRGACVVFNHICGLLPEHQLAACHPHILKKERGRDSHAVASCQGISVVVLKSIVFSFKKDGSLLTGKTECGHFESPIFQEGFHGLASEILI